MQLKGRSGTYPRGRAADFPGRLTCVKAHRFPECHKRLSRHWAGLELKMTESPKTEADPEAKPRTIIDSIEVTGSQVIDQVKHLIKMGNVSKLRIKDKDDDFSLEMPMSVGVLVGGAVVLSAPWLAILGVIAGLVTKVTIDVERDAPADIADPGKTARK